MIVRYQNNCLSAKEKMFTLHVDVHTAKEMFNTAMRRILRAPKWAAQAAIRGEIGISNMKSRIARSRLLYLRWKETGNNEVLKRIIFFIYIIIFFIRLIKKKYMNCAQIEEWEIKEGTAKEIRGKIANVVEEEWRKELEKNSLGIYRRLKKIERGGLQRKSRVNGVAESENKLLKSRRSLLAKKKGDVCGMQ